MLKEKQSDQTGASKKRCYGYMSTINDVTTSLNAIHLTNTNEWINNDMEIDNRAPSETELVDEMMSNGERQMYEIYVERCSDNAAKAMDLYLSIMSNVVGGRENAIAVLVNNRHDMNYFVVNLTRPELEKLVEINNEQIRGIYPPYKPV